jgi:hypothetical protein
MDKQFLKELKTLCDEYDYQNGSWPESKYEGKSIYQLALNQYAQKYLTCCGNTMIAIMLDEINGWECSVCRKFIGEDVI